MTKQQKATGSCVKSFPSVGMKQLSSHWTDFQLM